MSGSAAVRPRVVIRADASADIGLGHVMRCLALGQAWMRRGGEVAFVTSAPPWLHRRLESEGFDVIDADVSRDHAAWETVDRAMAHRAPRCLVLDGYEFKDTDQRRASDAGYLLAVMDDMANLPCYHAGVIVNSAIGAESLRYRTSAPADLLLGTQYVLLRGEFLQWADWRRKIAPAARRVLVSLGGTDPLGTISTVLPALAGIDRDLDIVVAGSAVEQEIRRCVPRSSGTRIDFRPDVADMSALISWADVAVSGAGSTCWEMAFMGLPTVCIVMADNQSAIGHGLARHGTAINLGKREDVTSEQIATRVCALLDDPAKRSAMSAAGRALVDGRGADRVAEACWSRIH